MFTTPRPAVRRAPLLSRVLTVTVLLALGLAPAGEARETASAPRLLFTSDRTGLEQIYSITSSGRGLAQLTFDCQGDYCPASDVRPAPDGRWIAFSARTPNSPGNSIWIATADGRGRWFLARGKDPVWSPDSRLIAYASPTGIRVVLRDGTFVEQASAEAGDCRPAWAPSGRALLFVHAASFTDDCRGQAGRLFVRQDGVTRTLDDAVSTSLWSADGRWIGYVRESPGTAGPQIRVVRPDGTGGHSVGVGSRFAWSPDGRWIAYVAHSGSSGGPAEIRVVHPSGTGGRRIGFGSDPAWSPDGRRLAFLGGADGAVIRITTLRTWTTKTLTRETGASSLTWSPSGDGIAYLARSGTRDYGIRFVTPGGRVRTILRSYPYGGKLSRLAWTSPPSTARYRRPAAVRTPHRIMSATELAVWAHVDRLAADGPRVAYGFGHASGLAGGCNVSVWEPTASAVVPVDLQIPAPAGCRNPFGGTDLPFFDYSLALSGGRLAYAFTYGGTSYTQSIVTASLARPFPDLLAGAISTKGERPVVGANVGDLLGDGSLLVFSTWSVACRPGPSCRPAERFINAQSIWRIRDSTWPGGCPAWSGRTRATHPGRCQELASSDSRLEPLAVAQGRIVAARDDDSIAVLDATGQELRSIALGPGTPLAAALDRRDLVVLTRGRLHHYDAETGALLHAWPLPDVASGGDCGCVGFSIDEPIRLRLEDAARGLVAYLLDGKLHLLRLGDGADVSVGDATAAQLEASGLFYAYRVDRPYPGRIRFVPFDRLPLR